MKNSVIRVAVYLGAMLVIASLVIPATADRRPVCVQAKEWVQSHRSSLPGTQAELAAFPPMYRWTIFNYLSNEQKAAVWQSRLAQALTEPLTDEESALIREAQGFVTPALYAAEPAQRRLPDGWADRAKKHLRPTSLRLVTTIADGDGAYTNVRAALVLAKQRLSSYSDVFAIVYCSCSAAEQVPGECPAGLKCCGYLETCEPIYGDGWSFTGCGWFNMSACEGRCYTPSATQCLN